MALLVTVVTTRNFCTAFPVGTIRIGKGPVIPRAIDRCGSRPTLDREKSIGCGTTQPKKCTGTARAEFSEPRLPPRIAWHRIVLAHHRRHTRRVVCSPSLLSSLVMLARPFSRDVDSSGLFLWNTSLQSSRSCRFVTSQRTLAFQATWAPIAARIPPRRGGGDDDDADPSGSDDRSSSGPYKIVVLMKQCIAW